MRVLIADDDPMTLTLLEVVLQDLGHEVLVAHDGWEAWDVMQGECPPSLIILDWMMPGLNGTDICRRLRQERRGPYQYLIMLTSKDSVDDLVESIGSGADDYLRKPFDPRELCARLQAGERILALQDVWLARATYDALTGLLNRTSILERLNREMERAVRTNDSSSIILLDLDNFKAINDTHGHQVGDEVLMDAANRLPGSLRRYDEVGRYGGEEFLVVLPSCSSSSALQIAERMRESLSTAPTHSSVGPIGMSASFGVATLSRSQAIASERLIAEADAALYRAKRAGRNRVEGSTGPIAGTELRSSLESTCE
jgi:diguanylate cyclase (GGDEF)-like protein